MYVLVGDWALPLCIGSGGWLSAQWCSDVTTARCHDFTLLAMSLALFFPLFAPSSRVTQVILQETTKNII